MRSIVFNHSPGRAAEAFVPEDRMIPAALRAKIIARDEGKCVRCGATGYPEIDHAIPWAVGGKTSIENLQLLCHGCNMKKGCKTWWGPTVRERAIETRGELYVARMNKRSRL